MIRYTEAQSEQFFEQVAERARAVPGVKTVTMTTAIPMSNDSIDFVTIAPEGFQFPPGKENVTVLSSRVDEHYFDTMAIALVKGRNFTVDDDLDAPRVAIVNQQLAAALLAESGSDRQAFRLNDADKAWVQIVGVAKTGQVHLHRRSRRRSSSICRTGSASRSGWSWSRSLPAIRQRSRHPLREVVRGLDVNQPIFNVRTMEELYRMRAVSIFNVLITMVGAMGLMGLGLAIVGLYGLVAYAASRRTREIGIRMAIGANRADRAADGAASGRRAGARGTGRRPGGERRCRRVAGGGVSAGGRSEGHARARVRHPDRAGGDVPRGVHPGAASVEDQSDAGVEV